MSVSRAAAATTRVSTKGQVILPRAIRDRRRWAAGTRLTVEETPEGVLLKRAPMFPPTRPEGVFGMLNTTGRPSRSRRCIRAFWRKPRVVMLALDTDIVIRYLANDDAEQSGRAKAYVDAVDVVVSTTVILEAEWVLRSVYRLSPSRCAASLRSFAGLPHVRLTDPVAIAIALDLMDAGMDFADAVHLQAANGCEALISFDRDFAKAATRLGTVPVRAP